MSYQGGGPAAISTYLATVLLPSMTTININSIQEYEDLPKSGFPAATITWTDKSGEYADNARNKVTWTFTIRIYIDRSVHNFGVAKAETIYKSVGSELVQKLEANPKLGNTVITSHPFNFRTGYIDQGSNNIRLIEVQLECMDINTWR